MNKDQITINELTAQVAALMDLLIECTDNGELDGRLLSSYMEHYISNYQNIRADKS